jgi:hypothetical protein
MFSIRSFVTVLTLVLAASACTTSEEDEITKEEARSQGGKSDSGTDYCALFGWYGDGICDDFCVEPDPDCGPATRVCGGFAGFTCAAGEFCHYDADAGCGFADALGECRPTPEACIALYDPVCGCNGETYGNECEANRAGVSARASGVCGSDREPVSGMCIKNSNDSCSSDADCVSGGCGGELCYNPASGGGISTCECTAPVGPACGCVAGKCSWFE